ncbi:MAG: alkaline phosphatase D family protein [Bryobacterales bacterium]|nr:alkaline phosphatase D family protein [Bryobacterales bacterium]MDE0293436.1 alkaline phosphatase D family protein [Bryobacterales bacterium]MDE0435136.1 alkaline phosphatase D family protein [Bryobacterales bacterium]
MVVLVTPGVWYYLGLTRHRDEEMNGVKVPEKVLVWTACMVVAVCTPRCASHIPAQEEFPIGLAQGVLAGEVADTSVLLQSRLTSTHPMVDRHWSGIVGIQGFGRFEIAENSEFRDSRFSEWIEAVPDHDFIVKTKVKDLKPGTRHYYRLQFGPDREQTRTSKPGTFTTHSGAAGEDEISFAVVTGMNYSAFHHYGQRNRWPPYQGTDKHLGYPALAAMLTKKPDFFVATGDNVYYDAPAIGRAETPHQIRMKYQEQFSQQRYLDLFRETATYWIKDDHDHRFNDSDAVNPFLLRQVGRTSDETYPDENMRPWISGSGHLPTHETGIHMFREQVPVVDPKDPDPKTYRTFRVTKSLQVWFVEGRDYRSPNDMPDGPDKTIWGAEQKAWLKRTLLESDATFKILFSATPMVGPDSISKRDNHVNLRGFRHEGDAFFRWLVENEFLDKHFYIVCGDRHWQYHAVHPTGFEEFSSGALVDANSIPGSRPGDANSTDPEGKIRHDYHNVEPTGGFLLVTVKPGPGNGASATFEFFDEQGVSLYRHVKRAD